MDRTGGKVKRVLIVGKGSYIGESFRRWLGEYPEAYAADTVASRDGAWKGADFSEYETVVDCAGIAHRNNITESMRGLFYSVNRDLSIEIAAWAKGHGIRHFIILSSMNVYGDYCGSVADREAEAPTGFYGDSKLQGDIGIRKLEDRDFTVSCVRPPFVYGKGCPGNYNAVSRIARKTPVFPAYENKKSMIYIDNLCEFVRLVIDERLGGVLTPQNRELVSTADLVREIAGCRGRRIWFTHMFDWAIGPAVKMTKTARRAFADDCYEPALSDYWDNRYCVVSFKESIRRTEK